MCTAVKLRRVTLSNPALLPLVALIATHMYNVVIAIVQPHSVH